MSVQISDVTDREFELTPFSLLVLQGNRCMAAGEFLQAFASPPFCHKCGKQVDTIVTILLWPVVVFALMAQALLAFFWFSGEAADYVPWRPLRVSVFAFLATIGVLLSAILLVPAVVLKVMVRLFFLCKSCPACGSRSIQISSPYGLAAIISGVFHAWLEEIRRMNQAPGLICRLCKKQIWPGAKVLSIPFADWFPAGEALGQFNGMKCHPACWNSWPLCPQFIEQFNRFQLQHRSQPYFRSYEALRVDGSVDYLAEDGTVLTHERGVFVARLHDRDDNDLFQRQ